jgi:hypothetical protein
MPIPSFVIQNKTEVASAEVGQKLPKWWGLWKTEKQWSAVTSQLKLKNYAGYVVALRLFTGH